MSHSDTIPIFDFVQDLYHSEALRLEALLQNNPDYLRSEQGIREEDRHSDLICLNITHLTEHLVEDVRANEDTDARTHPDRYDSPYNHLNRFLASATVAQLEEDREDWNTLVRHLQHLKGTPMLRALKEAMRGAE